MFDEPASIKDRADEVDEQFGDSPYTMTWGEARKKLEKFRRLSLAQVGHAQEKSAERVKAPMQSLRVQLRSHALSASTRLLRSRIAARGSCAFMEDGRGGRT